MLDSLSTPVYLHSEMAKIGLRMRLSHFYECYAEIISIQRGFLLNLIFK